MDRTDVIRELRELIVRGAPESPLAEPVRHCGDDEPLDTLIPFSSLIVLGVVVAVEDRFRIAVTRESIEQASRGGVTLSKLAAMIVERGRIEAKAGDGVTS